MRTKSILFTIAFFCLSMTAFAHTYDTAVSWTTDANGNMTISVGGPSSIYPTYQKWDKETSSYVSAKGERAGSYSVYVKDNNGNVVKSYNFSKEYDFMTIPPTDGTVYLGASLKLSGVPAVNVALNLKDNTLEVYNKAEWHYVALEGLTTTNGKNNATIKVTSMGNPLPAPVVTLLIALAFGGAFVVYRNRKQAKA